MCLAPPARIVSLRGEAAVADIGGTELEISLYLLPEPAGVGDYVVVHAGFAIQKIDPEAAREAMEELRTMAGMMEAGEGPPL